MNIHFRKATRAVLPIVAVVAAVYLHLQSGTGTQPHSHPTQSEAQRGEQDLHAFLRGCHSRNAAGECFNEENEGVEYQPYEALTYAFMDLSIRQSAIEQGCVVPLNFGARVSCDEGLKPLPFVLHALRGFSSREALEDCKVEWTQDGLHATSFSCPRFNEGVRVEREHFEAFLRTRLAGPVLQQVQYGIYQR